MDELRWFVEKEPSEYECEHYADHCWKLEYNTGEKDNPVGVFFICQKCSEGELFGTENQISKIQMTRTASAKIDYIKSKIAIHEAEITTLQEMIQKLEEE